MLKQQFDDALEKIINEDEGGWVLHDVPDDFGGITYGGVAQQNLIAIAMSTELRQGLFGDYPFIGNMYDFEAWEAWIDRLAKGKHDGRGISPLEHFRQYIRNWYYKTYGDTFAENAELFPWGFVESKYLLSTLINMRRTSFIKICQNAVNIWYGRPVLLVDGIDGPNTRAARAELTEAIVAPEEVKDAVLCLTHAIYWHYIKQVDEHHSNAKFIEGWTRRIQRGLLGRELA